MSMKTEAMPTNAEFKFDCPTCGQHILVAPEWSGMRINCPSCESRIAIPAPPGDAPIKPPASPSNATRPTIRIELPVKSGEGIAGTNGHSATTKPDSAVVPTEERVDRLQAIRGIEPWSELVRKLEKGTPVASTELATALFHELVDVRRRLDELESRANLKSTANNGDSSAGPIRDSVLEGVK